MSITDPAVTDDILAAAMETYDLELAAQNGLNSDALRSALGAGIRTHERKVLERIARHAETLAEESDAGGVLRWFAAKVREELPPMTTENYEPQNGDVVEVTITGEAIVWDEQCDGCGSPVHEHLFSVTDDNSGVEYFFGSLPKGKHHRVRALVRSEEFEEEL